MALPFEKTSTEVIILKDELDKKLLVTWTTVPTTTTTWYAKGCIFIDTDVVAGTSWVYFNKGTNLSCEFELAQVASTGTFTDITATWLITATAGILSNDDITLGDGDDLVASATSKILVNTDKFTVDWANWNTVIAWTATITGLATLTAGITGKTILASKETIAGGWTTTALDLTVTRHDIDADAGWDTFTLADWVDGQIMIIVQKSATGISTVTPATFLSGTSVTMATAGASVMLCFQTTLGWSVIGWNAFTVV